MGEGSPIGRKRHSSLKTFIWFIPPPQHCTSSTLYFLLGSDYECKSELFREACVFHFTSGIKKKNKGELPLCSRLQELLPLDLKRTPAAAPTSNELVASDTVGEQRSRGRLQYFCCIYPLLRIQPPNSHLSKTSAARDSHVEVVQASREMSQSPCLSFRELKSVTRNNKKENIKPNATFEKIKYFSLQKQ